MHRELDAYAGRHIPFSDNDEIGFHGKFSFTQSAFDFVNCEIDAKNIEPSRFYRTVTEAAGVPLVFQYRETSVEANRRFLALTYATGTWMMMPWDVYMPHDAPRYFGKAEDYTDLSGFVRGNADVLDGYEDAAAVGKGIQDARYGAVAPLSIEGGSGEVYAFARARPGIADAPVVIHVIEWAKQAKPMTLRLHGAELGGGCLPRFDCPNLTMPTFTRRLRRTAILVHLSLRMHSMPRRWSTIQRLPFRR
jgi:hypothetical protein